MCWLVYKLDVRLELNYDSETFYTKRTLHLAFLPLIKIRLRTFKSSEHIFEKGDGPYRGFGYSSLVSDPLDLATWGQRELQ